MNIVKQHSN